MDDVNHYTLRYAKYNAGLIFMQIVEKYRCSFTSEYVKLNVI